MHLSVAGVSVPGARTLAIFFNTEVSLKSLISIANGAVYGLTSGQVYAQNCNMIRDGDMWEGSWMGGYGGF